MQAAHQGNLPPRVIKIIDEARRYAEGAAFRIEVHKPQDVDIVKRIAAIKLAN